MDPHLHWQQVWGLLHDHKDSESAFCPLLTSTGYVCWSQQ